MGCSAVVRVGRWSSRVSVCEIRWYHGRLIQQARCCALLGSFLLGTRGKRIRKCIRRRWRSRVQDLLACCYGPFWISRNGPAIAASTSS